METTQTPAPDLRTALQTELLRRCKSNPGYSLRSFAGFLRLSPGSLSRILRGERRPARPLARRLAFRLGLTAEAVEACLAAPAEGAASAAAPTSFRPVAFDSFSLISEWYHFAILELTGLASFKSEPRWISRALGLTVSEVRAALERLERLGFLELRDGRWVNVSGSHTFIAATIDDEARAAAYRALQRQLLEKAIRALDEVEPARRDQTGMTMAVDSRRLPEAVRRIAAFRRELCAFLEEGSERDAVYQLSVSLFPLTRTEKPRSVP